MDKYNSQLWKALDFVVNAGLVEGDTEEDRTLSAMIEVEFEIQDHPEEYDAVTPDKKDIEEFVRIHYDPRA